MNVALAENVTEAVETGAVETAAVERATCKAEHAVAAPELDAAELDATVGAEQDADSEQIADENDNSIAGISEALQQELIDVFKLLSSGPRLKILLHLARDGELNVSDLCSRIQQTQPAVSHHLALLRLHEVVHMRRDGKRSFYSVNQPRFLGLLTQFVDNVSTERPDTLRIDGFLRD